MKIKLIDYGIAVKVGDIIYINKDVKKYPKLYNALINHEKAHTDTFELKDVIIDLNGTHLKDVKKLYYKFILKHPKSLLHFVPVLKYGGKWSIDLIMLFAWLFLLFMLALIIRGI